MTAYFIKSGDTFTISPSESLDIRPKLPTGTYIVKYDDKRECYYLQESESFGKMPSKIYGDTTSTANRIMNTYQKRTSSTGVLLAGEKGSGKTLLAKKLSLLGAAGDIPTLIINSPFFGDVFNKFMQDIEQECIVMFDEFEKIYGEEDQEQLLTLLDGVFPQKKLFILTCNNVHKVDSHLQNRPGRIFYFLKYKGLEESFIREYLADNLKDQSQVEPFMNVVFALFDTFNFDMMQALVEDMNRYNEPIKVTMQFINARPNSNDNTRYRVEVFEDGVQVPQENVFTPWVVGNPIATEGTAISFKEAKGRSMYSTLTPSQLVEMDVKRGVYTFKIDSVTYKLTKEESQPTFDYMNAF